MIVIVQKLKIVHRFISLCRIQRELNLFKTKVTNAGLSFYNKI